MKTRLGDHAGDLTLAKYQRTLAFELDGFQVEAMEALRSGRSVVVAAPTGSGKTQVAEFATRLANEAGLRVLYTTPLKALSNQKFADLGREHGTDSVGLLTGDHSIRPDAPIVVMTTEVLRNMLYAEPHEPSGTGSTSARLQDLAVVILDEVHYLQDPYRGGVWEEIIIHLSPKVALVALSATVSNVEEFADWVETVRGDTDHVIEDRRPVPLEHEYCFAYADTVQMEPTVTPEDGGRGEQVLNPEVARLLARRRGRGRHRGGLRIPLRSEIVDELNGRGLLPAIYFIFSRQGCDRAVEQLLQDGVRLTTRDEREKIRDVVDAHLSGLDARDLDALGYGTWLSGLEAGLAPHHAGLVPPFRETVEDLFLRGLVKVVFATETLSLGINMPARTVVIEKLTKFTGERHERLTPGQYTQLAGRAGRRGIDTIGYAVVAWSPYVPYEQVARLVSARSYELVSSFRPTYNMTANLVARFEREQAHHVINSSFAQFQTDRRVVRLEADAERRRRAATAYIERAACDHRDAVELAAGLGRKARAELQFGTTAPSPGDVVVVRGRPCVIVQSAGRGGTRLRVVAEDSKLTTVGSHKVGEVVGAIELPKPARPKESRFRREVSRRLRTAGDSFDIEGALARRRGLQAKVPLCRRCPDPEGRSRWLARAQRSLLEVSRLERRIDRRAGNLSLEFDQICALLDARGHVDNWALTDKGHLLTHLFTEADLLLAEALWNGVFDDLSPPELAALVSLVTYEARRESPVEPLPAAPRLRERADALGRLAAEIRRDEGALGLAHTRGPDPGFAAQVYDWADGRPLAEILTTDLTGGDFVRNVRQLVDVLRQVAGAARGAGHDSVAQSARLASESMWRGVVALSTVEA